MLSSREQLWTRCKYQFWVDYITIQGTELDLDLAVLG